VTISLHYSVLGCLENNVRLIISFRNTNINNKACFDILTHSSYINQKHETIKGSMGLIYEILNNKINLTQFFWLLFLVQGCYK
jgi:hypothetical protein